MMREKCELGTITPVKQAAYIYSHRSCNHLIHIDCVAHMTCAVHMQFYLLLQNLGKYLNK